MISSRVHLDLTVLRTFVPLDMNGKAAAPVIRVTIAASFSVTRQAMDLPPTIPDTLDFLFPAPPLPRGRRRPGTHNVDCVEVHLSSNREDPVLDLRIVGELPIVRLAALLDVQPSVHDNFDIPGSPALSHDGLAHVLHRLHLHPVRPLYVSFVSRLLGDDINLWCPVVLARFPVEKPAIASDLW